MMNRIGQAVFVVVILALTLTVPAYAEAEFPPDAARLSGIVLSVEVEQQILSMRLRSGREVEVFISSETQFHSRSGDLQQLEQISSGMWVVVSGHLHDGVFMAKRIIAGGGEDQPQHFRIAGEITNIIPGHETIEITSRAGESLCISVSEHTRFRSRDDSIGSFSDLKKGMIAVARGVIDESGTHLATIIVAGEREDVVPAAERVAGRIIDVGKRDFTMQKRGGELVTIVVDEQTKFRSRNGNDHGLEDLQPGMSAIVVGKDLGNDQMKAWMVGAWMPEN